MEWIVEIWKILKIENVNMEKIDSLIYLCIPPERRNNSFFIKGMNVKRVWASKLLERFGDIAKIAYLGSKPVGLIQYQPKPEEELVEITCIFVPDRQDQRKGIGTSLWKFSLSIKNAVIGLSLTAQDGTFPRFSTSPNSYNFWNIASSISILYYSGRSF